ncbi:lysosomal acid lipase/cholesteryl ester hydrolase-like [Rhineura floridana]|uniref:lysosomal acid lipase/cholesteryl ester hydrolase-like n=1 Tax=Rhineura floridana TaxID=261503 RepID=UPI002AC8629B|nr:lysosomal acid lipase/cholesteryl ester hydrolase-like [Rhineura floridana]
MWGFILVACLCQGIFSSEESKTSEEPVAEHTVDPECFMNISEIIHHHGYPSEEHHVETEDGYILTVFRIPHGRYNGASKGPWPVVFLQHAVIEDASCWISNMPNNSFGFILADASYDVWLGNSRGNIWSSKHKTMRENEQKFWEFSIHEMGYYDIPAVLYFILNKTRQQQLYYVGHSEGSAIGFIAFSTWPKLAERVKVFFALGPVTTLTFCTTPIIKAAYIPNVILQAIFGHKGIFQYAVYLRNILTKFCTNHHEFCASALSFMAGNNVPNLNMSRMDMYVAHALAGTSVQNLLHWIQIHHTKQFQAYDHGSKEKNMEKYNQTNPPKYKIEDIQIPIALWTAGQDSFVHPTDVAMLRSRISNLIYENHIPEWQHLDFIWGIDATERMYMNIIETMKKYP